MYGPGAFYDLDVEGHQAKLATDISKGQKCVVATPKNPNKNRDIAFEWFVLARIAIKSLYQIFIDTNGNFKHGHSVFWPK